MSDSEDSIGIGSSRVRNLTEKGKTYHLQILEDQRSSAQRSWQKQLNRVISVIADTTNQNLIMSERTFLEAKMEILSTANEKFYDFLEGDYDAKKEALMKFESIEHEHSDTFRKVNERMQRQDTLSLPDPEISSGDLLDYPVWLKSFETIIEGQTEEASHRLYYLGKYTRGEPKEAISGLLLLVTEDAYKQARRILSDRFPCCRCLQEEN